MTPLTGRPPSAAPSLLVQQCRAPAPLQLWAQAVQLLHMSFILKSSIQKFFMLILKYKHLYLNNHILETLCIETFPPLQFGSNVPLTLKLNILFNLSEGKHFTVFLPVRVVWVCRAACCPAAGGRAWTGPGGKEGSSPLPPPSWGIAALPSPAIVWADEPRPRKLEQTRDAGQCGCDKRSEKGWEDLLWINISAGVTCLWRLITLYWFFLQIL